MLGIDAITCLRSTAEQLTLKWLSEQMLILLLLSSPLHQHLQVIEAALHAVELRPCKHWVECSCPKLQPRVVDKNECMPADDCLPSPAWQCHMWQHYVALNTGQSAPQGSSMDNNVWYWTSSNITLQQKAEQQHNHCASMKSMKASRSKSVDMSAFNKGYLTWCGVSLLG